MSKVQNKTKFVFLFLFFIWPPCVVGKMFVPYYILSETGVNDDHLGFADLDTNDIFSCVGRGLRMEDHHHTTTALSFFPMQPATSSLCSKVSV
jgi:hypothetical protein